MSSALVVDDHPFIRSSVKMLLASAGFTVIAEAGDGVEAIRRVRENAPDLIILELTLPRLDGLELIAKVTGANGPSKALVLTSQPALLYCARCMKAGAAGFVSKCNELSELVKAVEAVMNGYTYFPDLASNTVRRSDTQRSDHDLVQRLSDRELSILKQLALGMTNKQIGDAMLISNKTVSTYKTRLIEKLNVKSVVYLADFAKRNNLV
ncbi:MULTISPECIES: response regulator transcription factor [unclassified Pseudomonas]|jgi:two-component system response regulator EvgA|uniref:response regulator transcription factor n=1 Tax=unclassified Pseudomonas TaxID=196821 RepID=UPI000EBC2B24|nr:MULTISPECIES: response regulator transcription factor [unclassified Pseudomonas]MCS4250029.1 two-component system response regulator EvgA [Pseudomonas sp. BIGb0164]NWE23669.1 response regulator transcription factor [Pseudomonas sp. P7548]HCT04576.1 DNA-binding response regulator [Pseudomonas sp.]